MVYLLNVNNQLQFASVEHVNLDYTLRICGTLNFGCLFSQRGLSRIWAVVYCLIPTYQTNVIVKKLPLQVQFLRI